MPKVGQLQPANRPECRGFSTREGPGWRGPTPLSGAFNDKEKETSNPCHSVRRMGARPGYSQYCHWPLAITYAARIPLVTACASMQSARLLVRIIHQL